MNTIAFSSLRGFRVSNRLLAKRFDAKNLEDSPPATGSNDVSRTNRQYSAMDEGRRLAASEIADQAAKSRWLRIQRINHLFALTLSYT